MQAERKTDERREVHFVIEIIMGAKIAGANHDIVVGQSSTDEVRIDALDKE